MKLTLDSNVIEPFLWPDEYAGNENQRAEIRELRRVFNRGAFCCFVGERYFHLEAIEKRHRPSTFANYEPNIEINERATKHGRYSGTISIVSHSDLHDGNNPYFERNLKAFREIGVKLLRVPRLGSIRNPDLRSEDFAGIELKPNSENEMMGFLESDYIVRLNSILTAIESRGGGMSQIVDLGKKFARFDETWQQALKRVPLESSKRISEAIAEWADGDNIAAHYANKNDYLISLDRARSAGTSSVFSEANRGFLSREFGVQILSPSEALKRLTK